MTNEELLEDLKQFIATTVRMEVQNAISGLESEVGELRQEVRDGFVGVAAAIDPMNDTIDDHEKRLKTLEAKAA